MADEFSQKQMNQIRSAIVLGLGEILEEIVLPRLANIEDKQDAHGQILSEHSEKFDRIERKLDATITVTDRHDVRLRRIESQLTLPPVEFEVAK